MDKWITIEIINWEKYNPRTDRTSHSWFRVNNNIPTEKKLFGLDAEQRWYVVCLLAEACKDLHLNENGSSVVQFNDHYFSELCKVKVDKINKANQHLANVGFIRLPSGNQAVSSGRPTNERTDERTHGTDRLPSGNQVVSATGTSKKHENNFLQFWDEYPRKVGKATARRAWFKIKPRGELLEQIIGAVKAQKRGENWKREGGQYIPHPATWLNGGHWEDDLKAYQTSDGPRPSTYVPQPALTDEERKRSSEAAKKHIPELLKKMEGVGQ